MANKGRAGADRTRRRQAPPDRHEFFGYIKGLVAIFRAAFRPFLLA